MVNESGSPENWVAPAEEQASFARFTVDIFNMTDEQLEWYARDLETTDKESLAAAMELMEWCRSWKKCYEVGVKVAESAFLRMIVVCKRLCGREEIEKAYREN